MRRVTGWLAIVCVVLATGALAADTPIATTELRIADGSTARIVWKAKDAGVVTPVQGSPRDPRCAPAGGGGGGVIRFFSDRAAGSMQDTGDVALPCANWKAVGPDTNPRGFVYVDSDQSEGPCKRVTVSNGKGLKATCSGKNDPLGYDLVPGVDEGTVGALLRVGPTDRWCGSADATSGRDGSDGRTFLGKRAPAPASCPAPFVCGDGVVKPSEACDDGDLAAGDGCDAACQVEEGWACAGEPSVCGLICSDGNLDPGETCDDGDLAAGDGCDATCQIEDDWSCAGEPSVCALICSDGNLDPGETCDDGGLTAGDGCDATCQVEDEWSCAGEPSVCAPTCSDGILDPGESCDDGDLTAGDGCDAACQVEEHFTCVGEPSVCTTPCGDGLVVGSEECEDGGTSPGDGCSDTCTIEPGWACTGTPSVCTVGCGDGTVAGSEECDDANTIVGDGCSPQCAYEPLCFVTNNNGDPSSASVIKVLPDGSLTPIQTVSLNDRFTGGSAVTRCGRRVYFNLRATIAGLEVGLDGTLTPIPPLPIVWPFGPDVDRLQRLLCSPDGNVVFGLQAGAGLANSELRSHTISPVDGALTQVGTTTAPAGFNGTVFWPDFHPVTGDLFMATRVNQRYFGDAVTLNRYVYGPGGNVGEAQREDLPNGLAPQHRVNGLEFTADAGVLALFDFFDGTNTCFAQFNAPGVVFPHSSTMLKTCTSPRPHSAYEFVPRPEGGPLFYFQDGPVLYSAMFDGPSFTTLASVPALSAGGWLQSAFDGKLLVALLGGTDEAIATYSIAPDLITVTPNAPMVLDPRPTAGVLMPCPDL
jgi:cysteine-rich repeat protein